MIDEKKIEEAAIDASIEDTNKGIVRDGYVISAWADHELGFQEGFKAGVNWFLGNLWHDASEEPKKETLLLVEYYGGLQYLFCLKYTKDCKFPNSGIKRWLYIEDLLKGGK